MPDTPTIWRVSVRDKSNHLLRYCFIQADTRKDAIKFGAKLFEANGLKVSAVPVKEFCGIQR